MTRIFSLFLVLSLIINSTVLSAASYSLSDQSTVEISSTNFPDSIFMEKVKEYDLDSDNFLSDEEINKVTYMYLNYMQIKDLRGIEYFTNLLTLHADMNYLKTLDLSKNTKLKYLYCNNNMLTDIKLPVSLERLELFANEFTQLDLSNLKNLKFLYVNDNYLTHLDLSNNPLNEGVGFVANYNFLESITLPDNNMSYEFSTNLYEQLYPKEKANGYKIIWYKNPEKTEVLDPKKEPNITLNGQTLYAEYTPIEYTVKFLPNGGNGEMEAQSFTYDEALNLSMNKFTRDGYDFTGWVSDTGKIFKDGQEVKNLTSTDGKVINLKATWQTHDYTGESYNITLHANGGEGEDIVISEATYGNAYQLPQNTFSKEHAEFKGWSFYSDSNQVIYNDEDSINIKNPEYTNNNGQLDLYAVWETKKYEVNMVAHHMQDSFKVEHGQKISEPEQPLKQGYIFEGWKTTDEEQWDFNNTVEKDITLYAEYTPVSYNVVFNGNSADNPEIMDSNNFSMSYNESKVLPKNTYAKQYHGFEGWSLEEDGNVDFLDQANVFELSENHGDTVNLYPVWSRNSINITINIEGNKTQMVLNQGDVLDIESPSKIGYEFSGFKDDETQSIWNMEDPVTKDMSLTAQFTPISYTIKFNGSLADNNDAMNDSSLEVNYDQKVNLPKNLYQKENYTFVGWATEENGSVKYNDEAEIINLSQTQGEEITLYAVWKKDVVYVSINDGVNNTYQIPVEKGDVLPESINIERKGYTLDGWYTNETFESNSKFDLASPVNSSINLYAKWNINNYTITFKNIDRDSISYTVNDVITLEAPFKDGYEFLGWVDENGKEISSTIKNSAENINLYAQYKKIEDKNPVISSDNYYDRLELGMSEENKNKSEAILENTLKNISSISGNSSSLVQKIQEAYRLNKAVKGYIQTNRINEEEISDYEKKLISDALKTLEIEHTGNLFNVLSYFDISVPVLIDSELVGNISNLSESVTFSFAIPAQLQREGRIFKVLRIHNGEVSVIDPSEIENGILSFNTDRFSTYALAYTDPVSDNTNFESTDNSSNSDILNNPGWIKTGDTNKMMLYVLFMTSLAAVLLLFKRNETNLEDK